MRSAESCGATRAVGERVVSRGSWRARRRPTALRNRHLSVVQGSHDVQRAASARARARIAERVVARVRAVRDAAARTAAVRR